MIHENKRFVAGNIWYLMDGVGLSIINLASLLNVDPIYLYHAAKEEYKIDIQDQNERQCLTEVGNYFTITLDNLVLCDIKLKTW